MIIIWSEYNSPFLCHDQEYHYVLEEFFAFPFSWEHGPCLCNTSNDAFVLEPLVEELQEVDGRRELI